MAVSERIKGIDTFKVIASFFVICLHTAPFEYSAQKYSSSFFQALEVLVYLLSRLAVPYFFITSGYFFGKAIQKDLPTRELFKKYIKKLFFVFLSWTVFYAILTHHLVENILAHGIIRGPVRAIYEDTISFIVHNPVAFIFQGTAVHLWFIPSLIVSLTILTWFVLAKKDKYLLPFAIFLYIIGLMASSYARTPAGIDIHFNTRNGPFFGTLFVALGWWFSKRQIRISLKLASSIFAAGFILQVAEAFLLHRYFNVNPYFDYSLATVLFGTGAFLFVLSRPNLGQGTFLAPLAQLSMGIYLFHPFIYHLLRPFRDYTPPLFWDITIAFIVFAITVVGVKIMRKYQLTRPLVT